MRNSIRVSVLGSILALSLTASAADSVMSRATSVATPFDADGYSVIANTSTDQCLVGSNIDIKTMITHLPDLQKRGLVRTDVDAAHVNAHAWGTATALAFKIHPLLISLIFDGHPEVDHCGFVQTITGLDGKQTPAYGFSLTRAEYKKTDWKNISAADFPNATDSFTVFKDAAQHLSDESK